jgi:sugar phosphate isomerase/epimerase
LLDQRDGPTLANRSSLESATMAFIDRIGIDVGRKLSVEDAIAWAARNAVKAIDVQTDIEPNALESFDDRRCGVVRDACSRAGVRLALHTLSAVNVAEISPYLREAADQYLAAYIDLAHRIDAKWVIVHGGYHFTADRAMRKQAAIERLQRAVDRAEKQGVLLLLENLNGEPERAEVHYMPDTLADTQEFLARVPSPHLKWSFTINHAHYDPVGIKGFVDGMGMSRCGEVRVADNNGLYELHMHPGTGTVDFADMFRLIEGAGYTGPYTCGWGTLEQMLEGRAYLAGQAREAGVAAA